MPYIYVRDRVSSGQTRSSWAIVPRCCRIPRVLSFRPVLPDGHCWRTALARKESVVARYIDPYLHITTLHAPWIDFASVTVPYLRCTRSAAAWFLGGGGRRMRSRVRYGSLVPLELRHVKVVGGGCFVGHKPLCTRGGINQAHVQHLLSPRSVN